MFKCKIALDLIKSDANPHYKDAEGKTFLDYIFKGKKEYLDRGEVVEAIKQEIVKYDERHSQTTHLYRLNTHDGKKKT